MGEPMQFAYYYGIEAEQFAFYRVPRLLIKDKRFRNLSSDAKLLYGLMLDRMSLSMKNGWLDEENRAYIIYTVENMMEDLGCSKPTCVKIMRELDSEKGIGLIEKKRRGLGKPDIIYVKNFSAPAEPLAEEAAKKLDNPGISPEVKNLYFKKERNFTFGGKENYPAEVKDFSPNYTDYNQTDRNQSNPINLSWQQAEPETGIDRMMEASRYMEMVRTNIEYELYMQDKQWADRDLFHELYEAICEIVCIKRESVRIGGEDYPYELVKAKFLKLNSSHLLYVIGCMHATTTKISNIKAYMLTALYNAPITMNHYYQQEVQHVVLTEAVSEAHNLLANKDFIDGMAEHAIKNLQRAILQLEDDVSEAVKKTELQFWIETGWDYIEAGNYKETGLADLQKILREAEQIYGNENATQDQVTSMVEVIKKQIDSLVINVDKRIINGVCVVLAFICIGLGCIGIVLPILPTTPLFLLAVVLFAKGSKRFHRWFLSTGLYQKYLADFVATRSMRKRTKIRILLKRAKNKDPEAKELLYEMFRPLLIHQAMISGRFSEDLHQELSLTFLFCIDSFKIEKALRLIKDNENRQKKSKNKGMESF